MINNEATTVAVTSGPRAGYFATVIGHDGYLTVVRYADGAEATLAPEEFTGAPRSTESEFFISYTVQGFVRVHVHTLWATDRENALFKFAHLAPTARVVAVLGSR